MSGETAYFGEIIALVTALVWAVAVILFKKSGEKFHPLGLNLFKNILAFLLFLPTIYLFGQTLFHDAPVSDYLLLFLSGFLGLAVADTLFLTSLNILGAGLAAILACLYSPTIIILSVLFLDERLTWMQLAGASLIVAAVLTTVIKNKNNGAPADKKRLWLGISLGALSYLAGGIGVIVMKPVLERSPILWVTEVRLLSGIIFVTALLALHPGRKLILAPGMNRRGWGFTIAGSLAGAYFSMLLWLTGLKFTQASIAAALNQTTNIFIFLLAVIFLKEPVTARRVFGIILAVAGALLVTFG
ncbi:MAG: DMT family transporter [Candidatus Zixiibacteriota bacterium]